MPPRSKRQRAVSTPAAALTTDNGTSAAAAAADTSLSSQHSTDDLDECCICITTPVLPIKLPCGHKFCYLCAKGSAAQNHLCPLCRAKVPDTFFARPKLLVGKRIPSTGQITASSDAASSSAPPGCDLSALSVNDNVGGGSDVNLNDAAASNSVYPAWQYQGRGGGWWLYEERHRLAIEQAYADKVASIELLIAGYIYVVNFAEMKQIRKDLPSVTRVIRRVEQPQATDGITTTDGSDDANAQSHADNTLLQDASVKGVAGVSKGLLLPKDKNMPVLPATMAVGISNVGPQGRRGRKRKS